jgi:hypothetical protein
MRIAVRPSPSLRLLACLVLALLVAFPSTAYARGVMETR